MPADAGVDGATSAAGSGKPRLQRVITLEPADAAATSGPSTPEQQLSGVELQAADDGAAHGLAAVDGAGEEGDGGDASGAAVSEDEEAAEEPQDPRSMSLAKHHSALVLMRDRKHREAAALWDQVIAADPDKPEWYHDRGVARMQLGKDKEAVQDFTISLELPGCDAQHRYQALLFRGQLKQRVGDLAGADEDYKAAHDVAQDGDSRAMVLDHRRQAAKAALPGNRQGGEPMPGSGEPDRKLIAERIQRRKLAEAKKAKAPTVHRYGTAIIEELDPEEGSEEHGEEVAHRLAVGWQEAAMKQAVAARGAAARQAKRFEEALQRAREENQARADRNVVRQARRRSHAAAAEAAARERRERAAAAVAAAEAAAAAAPAVFVERTRIPIEVVQGGGGSSDSFSSCSSSRSSASRQAGYESESEGGGEQCTTAVEAAPAAQDQPWGPETAEAVAAAETAAAAAEAAGGSEPDDVEEAAAAEMAGESKAQDEEAAAAASETASIEAAAVESEPDAAPAPAAVAAAGDGPAGPAAAQEPGPAALLSDIELDGLKADADRLQQAGSTEAADKLYLVQRPADQRVWGNRAENHCKAQQWQQALDCCNEALALTSPSHPLPRHKLLFRLGKAYRGQQRLQEALHSFGEAEAAAEAEGEVLVRKQLARHTAAVLQEMAAQGIQPAPPDPATLGLPPLPVVLPPHAHVPAAEDSVADEAGGAPAEKGSAGAGPAATDAAAHAQQASAVERNAGNACFARRQWELALQHYERAAQLDPACKLALANQAAALLKLRRFPEAADAASKALALDSQYTKARYRRAHAYAGDGQPELALLDMQLVADASPGDAAVQTELAALKRAAAAQAGRSFLGPASVADNPLFSPAKRAGQ